MVEKKDFYGRDLVSIDDFSVKEINYVLNFAEEIKQNSKKFSEAMEGKMMAPLFFEKSTRTICSFQSAMIKMGGTFLDFDVDFSSLGKGERYRDTIKTIEMYEPDVFVVRHEKDGFAKFVAGFVDIPTINAGDGKNQHPTQTLLDLFSIKDIRGKIDGVQIVMAGDLKLGRTVHSLAYSLSNYSDCKMVFVSPESLKMPGNLLNKLKEKRVNFSEHDLSELEEVIKDSEIIYVTRVQRERFPKGPAGEQEYQDVCKEYCLKKSMLEGVDSKFRVMHPLPRVDEIDFEIDNTRHAYYFQQMNNGLYVRMALLELLIGENG